MENKVSISSWELFKAHGDNLIILKATCATPNMCRCVQVTFSVAGVSGSPSETPPPYTPPGKVLLDVRVPLWHVEWRRRLVLDVLHVVLWDEPGPSIQRALQPPRFPRRPNVCEDLVWLEGQLRVVLPNTGVERSDFPGRKVDRSI